MGSGDKGLKTSEAAQEVGVTITSQHQSMKLIAILEKEHLHKEFIPYRSGRSIDGLRVAILMDELRKRAVIRSGADERNLWQLCRQFNKKGKHASSKIP